MIVNTGSRTDIPAYFSEWFYNRIQEGAVMVRNPYHPAQIQRFLLDPRVVDCLVFCTKNPGPMLERLGELEGFSQFWGVTVTPYGREIEPHVPDKRQVLEFVWDLSRRVGSRAVAWRYDPIFITERYSVEYHIQAFERMAARLSGYTSQCVISFIDLYTKTKRNFPGVRQVKREERILLGKEFVQIGRTYGMTIRSCCEGEELKPYGVDCGGCMSREVLEQAIGAPLLVPKGKKPAREGCGCLLGSDIGAYNTCGHGCIYCYANDNPKLAAENRKLHNVHSPLLIGELGRDDVVKEAEQVTWIDRQLRLF